MKNIFQYLILTFSFCINGYICKSQPLTYSINRDKIIHYKELAKALKSPSSVYILSLSYFDSEELKTLSKLPSALEKKVENIARFRNLKELRLDYLPLTKLPIAIKGVTNIETIILSRLDKLDWNQAFDVLCQMPNLKYLIIQDCKNLTISTKTTCFSSLINLRISSSPLIFTDTNPLCAPNLKEISLENNYKNMVYKGNWLLLSKVERVNITSNPTLTLDSLFIALSSMKSLNELHISLNNYKTIPKFIYKLQNLSIIRINELHLIGLPNTITRLTKLSELNISSPNRISIEYNILDSLKLSPMPNNPQIFKKRLH